MKFYNAYLSFYNPDEETPEYTKTLSELSLLKVLNEIQHCINIDYQNDDYDIYHCLESICIDEIDIEVTPENMARAFTSSVDGKNLFHFSLSEYFNYMIENNHTFDIDDLIVWAIDNGDINTVKAFVKNGVDITHDTNALRHASSANDPKIIQYLIKNFTSNETLSLDEINTIIDSLDSAHHSILKKHVLIARKEASNHYKFDSTETELAL